MNSPKEKIYISLTEATKYCKYSQEYLSLRARQGKLKAIKFGRNWVTKKEWVEEYLNHIVKYNGPNSVTKEILAPQNLPIKTSFANFNNNARKELNFVKELIQLASVSDLKFGIALYKIRKTFRPALVIRQGFLVAFTISLVVTNLVFGQKFIDSTYKEAVSILDEISKNYDKKVVDTTFYLGDRAYKLSTDTSGLLASSLNSTKSFVAEITNKKENDTSEEIIESNVVIEKTYQAVVALEDIGVDFNTSVKSIVKEYDDLDFWLEERIVSATKMIYGETVSYSTKFDKGYQETDNYFSQEFSQRLNETNEKISQIKIILENELEVASSEIINPATRGVNWLTQEYREGEFLLKSLVNGSIKVTKNIGNSFVNAGKFLASPWSFVSGEVPLGIASEDMEEMRNEIKELREKGIAVKEIVKEVSKITQIQPVKEITKEVIRVDSNELAEVKNRVVQMEKDLSNKLSAPAGVISQPVYITERVSSPRVYQENADIVFQTVGSGSVIMSAATGLQLSGQQIVIDAKSTTSPLIYLADHTKIEGNLTITGSQTLEGPLTLNVDTTSPALTIIQAGTGDMISMSRAGGGSFVINESGFIVGVGTLRIEEPAGEIWEMGVTAGSLTYTGELTLASGAAGRIVLDSASGIIQANTGDTFYTEGGNPIRESGEELFKKAVSIFRYSMPSQTSSDSFIRISKHFGTTADISLPAALTGTTRKYRLVINYSDDIDPADAVEDNRHSDWRIIDDEQTLPASDSFELIGLENPSLEESQPYLTDQLTIPDTDWQIEVRVPTGKTIRIYQIYLVAYDEVD